MGTDPKFICVEIVVADWYVMQNSNLFKNAFVNVFASELCGIIQEWLIGQILENVFHKLRCSRFRLCVWELLVQTLHFSVGTNTQTFDLCEVAFSMINCILRYCYFWSLWPNIEITDWVKSKHSILGNVRFHCM